MPLGGGKNAYLIVPLLQWFQLAAKEGVSGFCFSCLPTALQNKYFDYGSKIHPSFPSMRTVVKIRAESQKQE